MTNNEAVNNTIEQNRFAYEENVRTLMNLVPVQVCAVIVTIEALVGWVNIV